MLVADGGDGHRGERIIMRTYVEKLKDKTFINRIN